MNKANYITVYVGADEVEDIDKLADRVEQVLEHAHGFAIAARTMKDAEVVGPMRLSLAVQISNRLEQRRARRTAPDGTVRS